LIKWQRVHRLVGSIEPAWVAENLFLDSLLFLKVLPRDARELLDLGAGAGFPGVPLKIVLPEIRLTLVEARSRRASFLSALVRELGLSEVQVINARAEELIDQPRFRFDAVVMRCAGSLDDVLPTAVKLLRAGGRAVASGPPVSTKLPCGAWVEVPGPRGARRFAVFDKPATIV
jgi:16S rRNA (guanine527-N7)-methyltransferase